MVALALLAGACGADDSTETASATDQDTEGSDQDVVDLSVAIASFDLAVGDDRRLLVGLFTSDAELLTFGEVDLELAFLGEDLAGEAEISQRVTGSFLPVPGWEPEGSNDRPTVEATDGRGVYAAQVAFDTPGNWGLRVVGELDDGRQVEGRTVFNVAAQTQVPAVGDPAPRTENHTIEDVEAGSVAPVALDSRAQDDTAIPDPHLHDTRISDAIEHGWPTVVIASTPVYCRTNFCGPLVETLADTAREFEDRAAFVHLEIYEDFDEQLLNDAAAAWIQPADGSGGGEPWVFLVGADGTITARWDNVLDLDELHGMLSELPQDVVSDAGGAA